MHSSWPKEGLRIRIRRVVRLSSIPYEHMHVSEHFVCMKRKPLSCYGCMLVFSDSSAFASMKLERNVN